jgi:hypothetical protein
MTYSCIAPLLMPVCAGFFGLAYLMYKYQLLYVYINAHQSGGQLWYAVFNMSLLSLCCAVCTLLCYVLIRGSTGTDMPIIHSSRNSYAAPNHAYYSTTFNGPFYCLLPLPLFIFLFWSHCNARFKKQSKRLSVESAMEIDKAVESMRRQHKATPMQHFKPTLYRQPSLNSERQRPRRDRSSMSSSTSDSGSSSSSGSTRSSGDDGGSSVFEPLVDDSRNRSGSNISGSSRQSDSNSSRTDSMGDGSFEDSPLSLPITATVGSGSERDIEDGQGEREGVIVEDDKGVHLEGEEGESEPCTSEVCRPGL